MLETYFESPKRCLRTCAPVQADRISMASPGGSRISGTMIPSRCAICARRRTSGTSRWNRVEHWPTWICLPSQIICEPVVARGPKGGDATTTLFSARGVTGNILRRSASAHAAARQKVRMLDPAIIVELLSDAAAEASRCRRINRQTLFQWAPPTY